MAIKMKKFLSSMATLLLLVQVVLPGAVAAQEAEAAGVDTSVSVSTAPSVESSNADNAADSQSSNEGAQSEGQDSVSLLNQVSEVLSKTTEVIEEVAASLATDFTKALEGVAEKVMDTFTKSDNQENSETSEENSETLSGASLPETEDQTGATQTENQT